MSNPLVTIAMSVHNGAATLGLAIRSILAQTYQEWELIVANDGSTDGTGEILSRLRDPRFRVIQEPFGNLGLAHRLNQCIQLARGQYIARMDADDVAYPQRLQRQVHFLLNHPEVDLLGTGAVVFKGPGRVVGCYPMVCTHEKICQRPWWGFPLAHPTWMGKRTWFVSHPYSKEHIRCEDQSLLLETSSDSRFAAMEEVLLGYRMERISAMKLGQGRLSYCRHLFGLVRDVPSALTAMRGVLIHGLAFGRDVLLDTMEIFNRRSRQSFEVANDQVLSEWHQVWCSLNPQDVVSGLGPRRN